MEKEEAQAAYIGVRGGLMRWEIEKSTSNNIMVELSPIRQA